MLAAVLDGIEWSRQHGITAHKGVPTIEVVEKEAAIGGIAGIVLRTGYLGILV